MEMMQQILEWARGHETVLQVLFWLSIVTFFGTLILIPILVIQIPEDYFAREKRIRLYKRDGHPVLQLALIVIKNIFGITFILTGIAMLVLPGQGLLTILIGVMLTDFPGKYRFERKLITRKKILRSVNWIRKKGHKPPLKMQKGWKAEQ
jgi:hypothetical protein